MFKTSVQFNDYVSLVVMLLMFVALVAGQADASTRASERETLVSPVVALDDRLSFDFDGHLSDKALKISVAIVTDLSHFRGEDE